MEKIKAVILGNELEDDCRRWSEACDRHKDTIEYRLVNLTSPGWLEAIRSRKADILLAKPGGLTARYKQLYDERIYIIDTVAGYRIFPDPREIYLYENKRLLSYWLEANDIPHPETYVFYRQEEALDFLSDRKLPVVAKTNIGASGSGVNILKTRESAIRYVHDTFSGKGSPQRTGPNRERGGLLGRGLHYLVNPRDIGRKIYIYGLRAGDLQKDFVIFQEYIRHDYEWRAVRIGNSYFAHKKLRSGEKASGTLMKDYTNPPAGLLDFVREITDTHRFYSQAIDIFESERGYLVNEMQCIFGQSDPYQMLVDGRPGRYIRHEGAWLFEEGDFARNECYDLRLEYITQNLLRKR
jgi:glutathione synthase/RimK-type ligase-like ATP-grasp enzyme